MLRNLIFATLIMLCAPCATAQTNIDTIASPTKSDSTAICPHCRRAMCKTDSTTTSKRKTSPFFTGKKQDSVWFGALNFGFVTATQAPKAMDLDMSSSFEISVEPIAYRHYNRSHKQYFSVGMSFDWRNFRMTGRSRFVKTPDGNIDFEAYPEGVSKIESSRIKLFSLGVPFRFGTKLGNHWSADVAAILNFNTFASIESRYRMPDTEMIAGETVMHRIKESDKDLHQQTVSVDFMAQVHWRILGLYVKYSPCKVIKPEFGPSFTPLSVGFSFFY